MEALFTFLRRCNVLEENKCKLQKDKIDISIIESMNDVALAATRKFCSECQRMGEKDAQRQSLLQKLRRKMGIDKTREEPDEEEPGPSSRYSRPHMRNNKLAARLTRKVEVGWIHEGKLQRKKHGGGTRKLDVSKNSKIVDILQMALDQFFPNGTSKMGKLQEFSVDILDYQEDAVLDEDVTVGELYSVLKIGMLRFYLCTKLKDSADTEDSVHPEPEQEQTETEQEHTEPNARIQDQNVSLSSSTSEVNIGAHIGEPLNFQLDDTVPILESDEEEMLILDVPTATPDTVIVIDQYSSSDPTEQQHLTRSVSFSPGETSTPIGATANSDLTDYEIPNVHIKIH